MRWFACEMCSNVMVPLRVRVKLKDYVSFVIFSFHELKFSSAATTFLPLNFYDRVKSLPSNYTSVS